MWDSIKEYVNRAGDDASVTGYFIENDPFAVVDQFALMPTEVVNSIIRELEMDASPFTHGIDPRIAISLSNDVSEIVYDWSIPTTSTNAAYSGIVSPMAGYAHNRGESGPHSGAGAVFESRLGDVWGRMRSGDMTYTEAYDVSRMAIVMVIVLVIVHLKGGL